MNSDNFENGNTLSDKEFRMIASGTENSLLDIKKQLLTVQTLKDELCRKEDIISTLNEKIYNLEKDDLLSGEYYYENRVLTERCHQLEKALNVSKSNQSLSENQLHIQIQLSESLRNEIESFLGDVSLTRNKSENDSKELSSIKAKLAHSDQMLQSTQDQKQDLTLRLKQLELKAAEMRNNKSVQYSHMEQDLQDHKEKYSAAQKAIVEHEIRAKDQGNSMSSWIRQHDALAVRLLEQEGESAHWKKMYSDLEAVVEALTGLSAGIRAQQLKEGENLEKGLQLEIARNLIFERERKDMDAAVRNILTGFEILANKLSSLELELALNFQIRCSQLKIIVKEFYETFNSKYSHLTSSDLSRIVTAACTLVGTNITFQEKQQELRTELGKKGEEIKQKEYESEVENVEFQRTNDELMKIRSDVITSRKVLIAMESKYKIMKSRLNESNHINQKQQSRNEDFVNIISVLTAERDRKDFLEQERVRLQVPIERSNKSTETDNEADGSLSQYRESELLRILKEVEKEEELRTIQNQLHDTILCVKSLSSHSVKMETRCKEMLTEKKLLKMFCYGYYELQDELSDIASNCLVTYSPSIQSKDKGGYQRGYNAHNRSGRKGGYREYISGSSDYYVDNEKLKFYPGNDYNLTRTYSREEKHDDNLQHTNKKLHCTYNLHQRNSYRAPSLRVISIYILAALRIKRLLLHIRSESRESRVNQRSASALTVREILAGMSQAIQLNMRNHITLDTSPLSPSLMDLISKKIKPNQEKNSSILRLGLLCTSMDHLSKVRATCCYMSEVTAVLKAKELLLQIAENRYGEQQKDLLQALREAEISLQDRHLSPSVSYTQRSPSYDQSNNLFPAGQKSERRDFSYSKGLFDQSDNVLLDGYKSERRDFSYSKGSPYNSNQFSFSQATSTYPFFPYVPLIDGQNERKEESYTKNSPTSLETESNVVLGDINRALSSPPLHSAETNASSRSISNIAKTTPTFISPKKSASSLENSIRKNIYSPLGGKQFNLGDKIYIEKIIAGDEKHVSVALRAYAMSISEEEKIIHSPGNLFSSTDTDKREEEGFIPKRIYGDDDIVKMAQFDSTPVKMSRL